MIWHWYWQQVAGNIWAMPLQAVIGFGAGMLLARPARKIWRRAVGDRLDIADLRRELAAIRHAANSAHRISADLHEKLTGQAHPEAPAKRGEGT